MNTKGDGAVLLHHLHYSRGRRCEPTSPRPFQEQQGLCQLGNQGKSRIMPRYVALTRVHLQTGRIISVGGAQGLQMVNDNVLYRSLSVPGSIRPRKSFTGNRLLNAFQSCRLCV
jgi:hypothetical protein